MLLTDNLYQTVLIEPASTLDVDRLVIVSGYASASFLSHHLHELQELGHSIQIELIIGMTVSDGLPIAQHKAFLDHSKSHEGISISYIISAYSVHSKNYVWLKGNTLLRAFAGSANYTNSGFLSKSRIESMSMVDPISSYEFYQRTKRETELCVSHGIDKLILLYAVNSGNNLSRISQSSETVSLTLVVQNTGDVHLKSGLNWGQRPGRDRNQAYIPIPSTIYKDKADFFPEIGHRFVLHTDDDQVIIAVRAQERGKAIHSADDNAELGRYFRNRLNVPSGAPIRRSDLDRYGRTDVEIAKIDESTYTLNFEP